MEDQTLFGTPAIPDEPGPTDRPRSQWELRTRHGYEFDEIASALQKSIRRGWEDEALFWAMELNESGFGAYCWRRLMVIASEDVGLGDPMAAAALAGLHYASVVVRESGSYKGKGAPWPEEMLLQAVMHLCRAQKNREANDAYLVIKLRMDRRELLQVPEVAVDQHTKRGRKIGRQGGAGWAYFEEEGRVIHPHLPIDGDRWHDRWLRESGIAEGKFKGFKE
jgi:replication-associated recombination protein RarA